MNSEPLSAGEVSEVLKDVPVRISRELTYQEFKGRITDVLRLVDIPANPTPTGVSFGDGVSEEDLPLMFALWDLTSRRFGVDHPE